VDNFREQAKRLRTTGAPRSAGKALIGGYISPQEGKKSSHTPPDAEYSSDGDASDYRTDVDQESATDEDNHVEDELEENETRLRKVLSKGRKVNGAPTRALAGKMAMLASKSSRGNLKEVCERFPRRENRVLTWTQHGKRCVRNTAQPSRTLGGPSEWTPSSSRAPSSLDLPRLEVGYSDHSRASPSLPEGREITGREAAVLQHAEQLMYDRTLYENPFPEANTLNHWVVEVWQESEEVMGGPERQSSRARALVIVSYPPQKVDSNEISYGSTTLEYDHITCLI
jgi:hypothetical protein